jgi:hypothetical protein
MIIMKKFVVFFLLLAQASFAQVITGEVELCGFLLGQTRAAVHHQLGKPIQKKITNDQWIYEFHTIKSDTSVYGLFKYPNWDTTRLYSIQINGDTYAEMNPFYGLQLGSKKEEADHVFGSFDHTSKVQDPPLVIQYYKNKNYSVEINSKGRIFGIQVFGNIQRTPPKETIPALYAFKNAVITKNVDSLLTYLAPDVEIFSNGKVLSFVGAARAEFNNPQSDLVKLLLSETHSVWFALAKEMAEGAIALRKGEESNSSMPYCNFFDSNVISEIEFVPHAGKWKVQTIRFR